MHVMILIEEHLDGIKEESIMFVVKKEQNVLEAFKWTGDVNQTEDPVWIVDLFKKAKGSYYTQKWRYTIANIYDE